jgi:hypothetical protein
MSLIIIIIIIIIIMNYNLRCYISVSDLNDFK